MTTIANLVWVNPNYEKCFSCGGRMLPWFLPPGIGPGGPDDAIPHSDDPPRQWHPLCYEHWLAYMVGWRAWKAPGWRCIAGQKFERVG